MGSLSESLRASSIDQRMEAAKEVVMEAVMVPRLSIILANQASPDAEQQEAEVATEQMLREQIAGLQAQQMADSTELEILSCKVQDEYEIEPMLRQAVDEAAGQFVLFLRGGDIPEPGFLQELWKKMEEGPKVRMYMVQALNFKGKRFPFQRNTSSIVDVDSELTVLPYFLAGKAIRRDLISKLDWHSGYGLNAERGFLFSYCLKEKKFSYVAEAKFRSTVLYECESNLYRGLYEKQWYNETFDRFFPELFKKAAKKNGGRVPAFLQQFLMFSVKNRINLNWNNKNKHVVSEEEAEQMYRDIGTLFAQVDDTYLFNGRQLTESGAQDSIKWVYGILKYGEDFKFRKYFAGGEMKYGANEVILGSIRSLKMDVVSMEYIDGVLAFDGSMGAILYSMADEVYLMLGKKKYTLQYTGRYAISKAVGVSLYKGHPFRVDLDISDLEGGALPLYGYARFGDDVVRLSFRYESHFSRISSRFKGCYWQFQADGQYVMTTHDKDGLIFERCEADAWKQKEKALQREMIKTKKKRALLFVAIRQAYFRMKPIMKKRPIWMYLDKIYKGGDSSEYLYRYASAQKGANIDHYYLIDKDAAEYKGLVRDGFKPLVRGSIKHRLIFLMADMMVISNSTVMAFNNFGMENSSYVRDLINFHVCCVQHGMSVQRIAVAQNRLRDNTKLYFCASQYEIENLSRPVYDYVGYQHNALKLTGVPRYDGLKDAHKKQIMISPTWRMQAAAPISKGQNEGEQRQYNPLFKESSYYKVFNALINDKRLLDAAKRLGYRIKYVLHPIVSSQVEDFDKNDFVDIVPAVGEMSYEQMFRESALMVTDFSGIQFDFAYMRKPIVYLHHKDIPQHYEEGSFFYDTMGFGEITRDNDELIDMLIDYMEHDCKMKEEYVRRADDFFYYNDHENCKRIYQEMIAYQEKYILPVWNG